MMSEKEFKFPEQEDPVQRVNNRIFSQANDSEANTVHWKDSLSSESADGSFIVEANVDLDYGIDTSLQPDENWRGSSVDGPKRSREDGIKLELRRHSFQYQHNGANSASRFQEYSQEKSIRARVLDVVRFTLFCLGFGVGLGNLWRFPYVAYKHGGGSFLLAYSFFMALVGIPLFFLELSLGQFVSSGPGTCWQFCPIFQGLGVAMIALSIAVTIPYGMTVALALHYLAFSLSTDMPWLQCQKEWATSACMKNIQISKAFYSRARCHEVGYINQSLDADCHHEEIVAGPNAAKMVDDPMRLPADEYFYRYVIGSKYGDPQVAPGHKEWAVALCYVCSWCVVAAMAVKGLKPAAKIMYVTALLPYVALLVLLIVFGNVKGAAAGMHLFFSVDPADLLGAELWVDAAIQVFYSLSVTFGGLIMLASLNDFHSDCLQYTFILTLCNYCTSFLCGLAVFCCIGVFAASDALHTVKDIGNAGPELIFIVYPTALSALSWKSLWGVLFFGTLLVVGLNNQLILVNTVASSIMDMFTFQGQYVNWIIPVAVCVLCALLGLAVTLEGEIKLYAVIDTYAARTSGVVIAFGTCVALLWIYGVKEFLMNVEAMIGGGGRYCFFVPWSLWKWYWAFCCGVFIPTVALSLIFLDLDGGYAKVYGHTTEYIWMIWIFRTITPIIILASVVVLMILTPGPFLRRLQTGITPTGDFAPALPTHRASVQCRSPSVAHVDIRPVQLRRIDPSLLKRPQPGDHRNGTDRNGVENLDGGLSSATIY